MENFKLQRAILPLSLLTFGLWSVIKVTASEAVIKVEMTTSVESTTGDDEPKKDNKKEKSEKTGKLRRLINQEYIYDEEVSEKKTISETPEKVEPKPSVESAVEKESKKVKEKSKKEKPEKTKKTKTKKTWKNETENISVETDKEVKLPVEVGLTPATEFKTGRPAHAGFPATSMGITWTSNIDGNTAKFTTAPNKLVILPDQAAFNAITTKEKLNQAFETGIKTGDFTVKGGSSFKPQYLIVQDGETLRLIEMTGIQFKAGESKAHFTERR